jgi:hypothetical protein
MLNGSLSLPRREDLVLVAVVPTPRDLEIARMLGWYRIPFRSAPRVIAVDYLAFYQPSSFASRKGLIEFVSQVFGFEMTTRRQLLSDEPDHPSADEEYLKVQVGGLIRLPNPVRAVGWKRLAFLYTTGEYLLTAETLNDLVVTGEDRRLLWRSIRDRALKANSYSTSDIPDLDIDAALLKELLVLLSD